MTSVAERTRHRRAARQINPAPSRAKLTVVSDNPPKPMVRETGLAWLLARKRIGKAQFEAGLEWGVDYRLALNDGMEPLRSCLNDSPGGGSGTVTMSYAAVEAEAKHRRAKAIQALAEQPDMIAALDAVCGRQLTPWEQIKAAGGKQRQVEEMQTTLRIALDILSRHYRLRNI